MTGEQLIRTMAETWVEGKGSSEGFVWAYQKILKEIRQMEDDAREEHRHMAGIPKVEADPALKENGWLE